MGAIFDELKQYTSWSEDDEAALRALAPLVEPEAERIADVFYERIVAHEGARRALAIGETGVGRLKLTLVDWMRSLLAGPWDDAYAQRRSRIGRVHVSIGLPQHYMFAAMSVLRSELLAVAADALGHDAPAYRSTCRAVGRVLDLELALMLESYRESLLEHHARSARLATFGQVAASIGHELRTPLAVMSSSLELLRAKLGDDPAHANHLDRMGRQIELATNTVTGLLDLVRDRPLHRRPHRALELIETALGAVHVPPDVQVVLDPAIEQLPPLPVDGAQLRQALRNLLENAVQAASPRGEVRVAGRPVDALVELAIEDTGPGVDPVTRRRLFEPLFTTKDGGSGLGLALVRRVVERHGGSVAYEPGAHGGARFVVRVPL